VAAFGAEEPTVTEEELIDLIPVVAEPVDVVVDIDHLTVRDDGEFFLDGEPYMLLSLFSIDGNSARIEATVDASVITSNGNPGLRVQLLPADGSDSIVSLTRRGEHRNVDSVNIGPLELADDGPKVVPIDSNVGVFSKQIKPIPIRLILDGGDVFAGADIVGLPGFVGVHAMLSEEDFTPDDAIVAAHEVVADGVKSILEDVLKEVDISDLSVNPEAFVERQAEIEDAAKAAAADEMNWWELLWGGVVDPDDQLIQTFTVANVLQLNQPVSIQQRYQGENGDWILVGEIRRG
jgi:hypothetical protein